MNCYIQIYNKILVFDAIFFTTTEKRTHYADHFIQFAGFDLKRNAGLADVNLLANRFVSEYVALVIDSEFCWTGFVKPQIQSFPHLRVD